MRTGFRAALVAIATLFLGAEAGAQPAHCATKTATGDCVPGLVLVSPVTGQPYVASGGSGGGGGGDASAAKQDSQIALETAIRDRIGATSSPAAGSTNARLAEMLTALGSPYQAGGALPLPAGAATASAQASAGSTLSSILTAVQAGDASATRQDTTNARLGDIASPATGSVNARLEQLRSAIAALGTPVQAGATIDTQSAAPGSTTALIGNGTTLSAGVDLGAQRIHRVHVPSAGWTAAAITFRVSFDGSTWADLYDAGGEVTIANAAAGRSIVIDQSVFYGVRYIQLRSGTAASPVAQGADRNLTLVTVPR